MLLANSTRCELTQQPPSLTNVAIVAFVAFVAFVTVPELPRKRIRSSSPQSLAALASPSPSSASPSSSGASTDIDNIIPALALPDPVVPPPARRAVGRPALPQIQLGAPLAPLGCPLPMGDFLKEIMIANSRGNVSQRTQEEHFSIFKRHFSSNPAFPHNFRHAKKLLSQSASTVHEFPVCLNDCYVHSEPITALTAEQIDKLVCPNCNTPLGHKGKAYKVSHKCNNSCNCENCYKLF